MGIVINTNVQSLNAQRLLNRNTATLGKSFERLASGFRINNAADDAAGLQISENLRTQIRGSEQAFDNVQDGISVLTVLDGTLNTITNTLQRMRELSVQAANDTYSSTQRSAITQEVEQLARDITRMAQATRFNGNNLLDGSLTSFYIQVGANASATVDRINLGTAGITNPFANVSAAAISIGSNGSLLGLQSNTSAQAAISRLDTALTIVTNRRATLGALLNRLDSVSQNLSIAVENFSASESRIRNVDVAKETADLTKNQILQQASATVLAQANQSPQIALQLLQG